MRIKNHAGNIIANPSTFQGKGWFVQRIGFLEFSFTPLPEPDVSLQELFLLSCFRKRFFMKYGLLVLVLVFFRCIPAIASDQKECVIEEDEEYAVLTAVLFPNEPDIPETITTDLGKKAFLATNTIRLDGFHGSSYTLQDVSMIGKSANNRDLEYIPDFNTKNERACKYNTAKFQAHLLSTQNVRFISVAEILKQRTATRSGNEGAPKTIFGSEIARLTRPGFNKTNTMAVVEVDLQATEEMGVGFWVYMQKSPKTGKWFIAGAIRVRMY
jgi:hypothetical protein